METPNRCGDDCGVGLSAVDGPCISFVVFDADARSHTNRDRDQLLAQLADLARQRGLRVDKAAPAFTSHGRLMFAVGPHRGGTEAKEK